MKYSIENGQVECVVDGEKEMRKVVRLDAFWSHEAVFTRPVPETCKHEILQYSLTGEILITTRWVCDTTTNVYAGR